MVTPPRMRSKRSRTIVVCLAVLLCIAVGAAIYLDRIAPFRHTVLVVNDTAVTMDYFLKRILHADRAPIAMLQMLTYEAFIKQVAPKPPYNLNLTEADMEQALRDMARGNSETMTEPEFAEWYRQQLNDSQLSDAEFRDMIRASQLRQRLHTYLAEQVPAVTLETWWQAEFPRHQVSYHGFENGYDTATDAWVVEQLRKMRGSPTQGSREP